MMFKKSVIFVFLAGLAGSCSYKENNTMGNAVSNKEFVHEMISSKKKLADYPERISDSMVVYEPSSLPFGGVYKGYNAYEQFYPAVREFYDFSKFELLNVYGDENVVFAIIKAGIASINEYILLCEHFTFNDEGKLVEVRLFIYDYPNKPISSLLNSKEAKDSSH